MTRSCSSRNGVRGDVLAPSQSAATLRSNPDPGSGKIRGGRLMRSLHSLAIASALSALLLAGPVRAESIGQSQPEQLGFSKAGLDTLTEFFKAEVAAGKVPGVMLLVQRRGQPAYF